jgi:hypothetical protein
MKKRTLGFTASMVSVFAIVAAALLAAGPSYAKATAKPRVCATTKDLRALNVRVLQTELMVAALSCEEHARYNSFITNYRTLLLERSRELQSFFNRTYGSGGTKQLNQFITRIANDASRQSQERGDEYCSFASGLFEQVINSPSVDATSVLQESWLTQRHDVPPC